MRLIVVRCDAIGCIYNKKHFCDGKNGELKIDATEFNHDSTCYPVCFNAHHVEDR